MKKIFLLAAAVGAAFTLNAKQVQVVDTIFTDNFANLDNYTLTSPGNKIVAENNVLVMRYVSGSPAQNIAVSSYARDTALNEMPVDSLVWTFNMRQNYNGTLSGFDSSKRGIATMLVASGDDLKTVNGYAIALGGTSNSKQYRLVKVAGGLLGNDHLTDIIAGQEGSDYREYRTFRVVYIPESKTWKMQEVISAYNSAFVAPQDVETWTEDGTAVDDTYGNIHLNNFGFYQNYAGTVTFNAFFANFTLAAYRTVDQPDTPTALDNAKNANHCTKMIENGQMVIIRNGVKYSLTGAAL